MARLTSTPGRTIPLTVVNVGTFAFFVVWLAAAAYALAYLLSH